MNLVDDKPRIIKELELLVALYTDRLRYIINSHTCVKFEHIEPEAVSTLRIMMETKILEIINIVSPDGSGLMAVEVIHADETMPKVLPTPKIPERPERSKSPERPKSSKQPVSIKGKARHSPKEDQPKETKKRRSK